MVSVLGPLIRNQEKCHAYHAKFTLQYEARFYFFGRFCWWWSINLSSLWKPISSSQGSSRSVLLSINLWTPLQRLQWYVGVSRNKSLLSNQCPWMPEWETGGIFDITEGLSSMLGIIYVSWPQVQKAVSPMHKGHSFHSNLLSHSTQPDLPWTSSLAAQLWHFTYWCCWDYWDLIYSQLYLGGPWSRGEVSSKNVLYQLHTDAALHPPGNPVRCLQGGYTCNVCKGAKVMDGAGAAMRHMTPFKILLAYL